jgi:hypothetical protein
VPGGSAAGIGSDAKAAKALPAHVFKEDLHQGREPRLGVLCLWWVYFAHLHVDGTWAPGQ